MTLDSSTKRRYVLVLGLLTGLGAVTVDMSLASIPEMAPALNSTVSAAQQIIGVFILGIGLGQLPAGLMSDRVGRLPVIRFGLGLFTIAGILTAIAPSIETMLAARLAQGLGASVGIVVARAIVRDIASGEEAARMLSIMVMIFTAAPMLAPIVGGYLVTHIGWRAPFIAITVFGGIVFAAVLLGLSETGRPSKDQRLFRQLWNSCTEFFSHRRSLLGCLMIVLPAMGFMPLISSAPALIIEIYGYTPQQFGLLFAMAGLSILLGSMINRKLLYRLNTLQLIGAGTVIIGTASMQLLLIAWLGEANFRWLWGCVCLYMFGVSFLGANATAIALDPVPHIAGVSASLIGALQNILASGSAVVAGLIYDGTVRTSVILIGCFGIVTLLVFLSHGLILRRR